MFVAKLVNFTNVLQAAFMRADPENAKMIVKSSVSFCTFGICVR